MALWSKTASAVNTGYGVIPALPDPFYKPVPAGTYPTDEVKTGIHPELLMKPPYSQDFPTTSGGKWGGDAKKGGSSDMGMVSSLADAPFSQVGELGKVRDIYNATKALMDARKAYHDRLGSIARGGRKIPPGWKGHPSLLDPRPFFDIGGNTPASIGPAYYNMHPDEAPEWWKEKKAQEKAKRDAFRQKLEEAREKRKSRFNFEQHFEQHPELLQVVANKGGKRIKRGGFDLGGAASLLSNLSGPVMETIKALASKTGESVTSLLSNPDELITKLMTFAPKVARIVHRLLHKSRKEKKPITQVLKKELTKSGKKRIEQLKAYFKQYPEKAKSYLKQHPELKPYFTMYDTVKDDYKKMKQQIEEEDDDEDDDIFS